MTPMGLVVEAADVDPERVPSLLWEHGVIRLRLGRTLTDDEHRAVVAMVGPVKELVAVDRDGAPVTYGDTRQVIDAGYVRTDEERDGTSLGGDAVRPGLFEAFHTDDSYVARPALATVLHARALPSRGGATAFLDMRAAYAALSDEETERIDGLHVVHAYDDLGAFPPRPAAYGPLDRLALVSHPLVRAHPHTGVPALYVDLDRARHVDGMDEAEGRALLQSLQDRAEATAPGYAHEWVLGDVLLWDNAAVQHRASGDFPIGEPRRFWRYMVEGPVPTAFRLR